MRTKRAEHGQRAHAGETQKDAAGASYSGDEHPEAQEKELSESCTQHADCNGAVILPGEYKKHRTDPGRRAGEF